MYTKVQHELLENFADKNDALFDLGVTTTDSFTGEIGEYIVCKYFNLEKSNRSNKAVDGVSENGQRFQIKAKVITKNNYNYTIKKLQTNLFDVLVIAYFDKSYNPLKLLIISSKKIKNEEVKITNSNISTFECIEGNSIKIPVKIKRAINEFATAYNNLEDSGIIRSRRIVGDIGEYYARKRLNLKLSDNRNEKGIDATNNIGLTFEIKTRRVYESGRRISETRRINNLVGKEADYLIVVTLDRSFRCNGMWLIPMQNILNPKSANLKIVNTTIGTLNLIPSKIYWLHSGAPFVNFKKTRRPVLVKEKTVKNRENKIINRNEVISHNFQKN